MRSSPREAAVAGSFYPRDSSELEATVERMLQAAGSEGLPPCALVAPHAGYAYSGPIAAEAFSTLATARGRFRRVVVVGPSHFVGFSGIATSGATSFVTPLGEIEIDRGIEDRLTRLPQLRVFPEAHSREHSLEVELPFLQVLLDDFELVALVVGDSTPEEVSEVLSEVWQDDDTLLVISTDLSHFYDYTTAQRMDRETCALIEGYSNSDIDLEHACGWRVLNGFRRAVRESGREITTLDLRNSGDTAGGRDSVVGYGAWACLNRAARAPLVV